MGMSCHDIEGQEETLYYTRIFFTQLVESPDAGLSERVYRVRD